MHYHCRHVFAPGKRFRGRGIGDDDATVADDATIPGSPIRSYASLSDSDSSFDSLGSMRGFGDSFPTIPYGSPVKLPRTMFMDDKMMFVGESPEQTGKRYFKDIAKNIGPIPFVSPQKKRIKPTPIQEEMYNDYMERLMYRPKPKSRGGMIGLRKKLKSMKPF